MSIIILLVISVTCVAGAAPLSCDHPLRILQPELFVHCSTCFYGSWGNWYRIGHSLSTSQCKSGYTYQVERTRQDNYGKCEEELQQQYQCKLQPFIRTRDVLIFYIFRWTNHWRKSKSSYHNTWVGRATISQSSINATAVPAKPKYRTFGWI